MNEVERRLQNKKGSRQSLGGVYPSIRGILEGEVRFIKTPSKQLRMYVKENGVLYWFDSTRDGSYKMEKNLDVGTDLKIGKIRDEKLQPSFLAYNSVTDANIAVGSNVVIDFDTEVFDVGSNFASDIFTAPVTGKYFLQTIVALLSIDTAAGYYSLKITTSNRTYWSSIDPNLSADTGPGFPLSLSVSCVADMEKGDTATVHIYQSSGTQQTDILGHATDLHTFFSGYLLG